MEITMVTVVMAATMTVTTMITAGSGRGNDSDINGDCYSSLHF